MKTTFTPNEIHQVKAIRDRLKAIPDEKWCTIRFTSPNDSETHCVLGHLGVQSRVDLLDRPELYTDATLMADFLRPLGDIADINNRGVPTPKAGVLAAIEKRLEQISQPEPT